MAVMTDSVPVTRASIFKGSARVVYRVSSTVPAKLEDIMQSAAGSSPYELASGWVDVGPTTDDGVTITRSANLSDGIVVDQRKVALDKGEPESWEMAAEMKLMDTTYDNLKIALQGGAATTLGASTGRVAQHSLAIDAPVAFTERQFAFLQEDVKSLKSRAWFFRKCIPAVDSELPIKASEATSVTLKLTINTDSTIAEDSGQFGLYFEED